MEHLKFGYNLDPQNDLCVCVCGCAAWHVGSYFPDQGWNLSSLQWKLRV